MSANNAGNIVVSLLTGSVAVAALVATRIYPDESPDEAALPLIVYGVRLTEQIDGTAPISIGTVDVHCYAATDDEALALAVAADGALNGMGGANGATRIMSLVQQDWDTARDSAVSEWAQLLRYTGVVVRG